MKHVQTWKIKGRSYTHEQLQELKRQGFSPFRPEEFEMKFIANPKTKPVEKKEEEPPVEEPPEPPKDLEEDRKETEEEEFARLTKEKAWVNKEKKPRYDELKAKLIK